MAILLTNATAATMQGGYGLIQGAGIAVEGDRIAWVGPMDALPDQYTAGDRRDVAGRLVTPALIDCHTHAVFGGHRAAEFEMRLNGASYEDIARAGGGKQVAIAGHRRVTDPPAGLAPTAS